MNLLPPPPRRFLRRGAGPGAPPPRHRAPAALGRASGGLALAFLCAILFSAAWAARRKADPLPAPSQDVLVRHGAFSLAYRESAEQAAWVAHRMTRGQLAAPRHKRQDDFRADPAVATGSATPADYAKSGFDKGHLAPAADFAHDPQALSESFLMSNMSPQRPAFNRGVWNRLEEQVRGFARDKGEIWVVSGPLLDAPLGHIGRNRVVVPRAYFKIVYAPAQRAMLGFLLPNRGSRGGLARFVAKVDSIEALCGLDFFPQLPDPLERRLEAGLNPEEWFRPD